MLSLLLLAPGLAIKAGEVHEEMPKITIQEPIKEETPVNNIEQLQAQALSELTKETTPEFNVDFLLDNSEQTEVVRNALREEKEKGTLTEGIQAMVAKLKLYDKQVENLSENGQLEETLRVISALIIGMIKPEKGVRVLSPLANFIELFLDLTNETVAFSAAGIRKFSDYSSDQASYLVIERSFNILKAMQPNIDQIEKDEMEEGKKNFKENFSNYIKADIESLINCIRSNEMPDKVKDRDCHFKFLGKIVDHNEAQSMKQQKIEPIHKEELVS